MRPNAILIGSYSAPGHRCCPLASAVWEATGSEATSFEGVMAGIAELGFEPDHQEFIAAFDTVAGCDETDYTDGLAHTQRRRTVAADPAHRAVAARLT